MTEELRERIAKVLGWSVEDTHGFSVPTLRELVRGKDDALYEEIGDVVSHGEHLFVRRGRTQGRARFGKGRVSGCTCEHNFTCRRCLEAAGPTT